MAVLASMVMAASCKPQAEEQPVVEVPPQTAEQKAVPDATPEPAKVAEGDVRLVLDAWLVAQNGGDFAAYEALYGTPFRGVKRVGEKTEEFDRAGWIEDRQRMFQKPMKVSADAVNIRVAVGGATVRFVQTWSSGSYSDTGPKEITLQEADGGLRIVSEVMLRSTVGASGKRVERPPATTVEALLASAKITVVSSDNVLFDPRQGGGCGEDWDDCRDEWLRLDVPEDGFTRKTITKEQAAEYLGFLSDPEGYGAPPAACYMPRLVVAFYHADEVIPWATIGVCIECATLGTWPSVAEIDAAIPEMESGLGKLGLFKAWCERLGLRECVDDVPHYEVE